MKARRRPTAAQLAQGIREQDRFVLGRAITLIESKLPTDRELAETLLETLLPEAGKSIRIGITGIPGVGKSTFIEQLGLLLISQGKKVAVLTIDPSSPQRRGSILADKTRMEQLSREPHAFIRPSASGLSLGGVAARTREAMLLCEAAGYDTIIIETVGVGQSETTVKYMCDCFLLLMMPGAGDEIQGIKRGIMEMADLLVVNKQDLNPRQARQTRDQYAQALHLFPLADSHWMVPALVCSAATQNGLPEVVEQLDRYIKFVKENGWFSKQRSLQYKKWLRERVEQQLLESFYENENVRKQLPALLEQVAELQQSPAVAARQLWEAYRLEK